MLCSEKCNRYNICDSGISFKKERMIYNEAQKRPYTDRKQENLPVYAEYSCPCRSGGGSVLIGRETPTAVGGACRRRWLRCYDRCSAGGQRQKQKQKKQEKRSCFLDHVHSSLRVHCKRPPFEKLFVRWWTSRKGILQKNPPRTRPL